MREYIRGQLAPVPRLASQGMQGINLREMVRTIYEWRANVLWAFHRYGKYMYPVHKTPSQTHLPTLPSLFSLRSVSLLFALIVDRSALTFLHTTHSSLSVSLTNDTDRPTMQLTTLLTLLPLLTAINAVPACNRPGGADASSSRRRKHHQTRSRAPQVVPVTGAPVSSAVSTAPLAGPGPTSEPSEASVIPLPSVMDDTPASSAAASASASTTVSVAPVVPSPVGGGNNAPASSAPASSAVATTSRAAAAPASSAVVTTSRPAPAPVSSAAPAPAPAPVSSAVSAPPTSNGVSAIGMAMNYESKANIASFGGDIGWYYSWNLDTLPNTAGLEFVPMIWGADAAQRFDGNLREGSTHVLGFNERESKTRGMVMRGFGLTRQPTLVINTEGPTWPLPRLLLCTNSGRVKFPLESRLVRLPWRGVVKSG